MLADGKLFVGTESGKFFIVRPSQEKAQVLSEVEMPISKDSAQQQEGTPEPILAGAAVSFSLWADYQKAPSEGPWGFGMVAVFTVLLFIFCLYSFAKARSVGSSRVSKGEIPAEPSSSETVTSRDVPE